MKPIYLVGMIGVIVITSTSKSEPPWKHPFCRTAPRVLCIFLGVGGIIVVIFSICVLSSEARAMLVLRDTFDTNTTTNNDIYDTRFSTHLFQNGSLVLSYTTTPNSPPNGLECTLPLSSADPVEREIDMSFGGGGTEVSNSLFVCYAVGGGNGLLLPTFPYGPKANSRSGNRTGYGIRFLRHGDGTNEIIFYRSDTGWIRTLKNEWLPANPVTTLRQLVIKHRKNGDHLITVTFDTGILFTREFRFDDHAYPPNNAQRGIQFIAKAHSAVYAKLQMITDSWIVRDASSPDGLEPDLGSGAMESKLLEDVSTHGPGYDSVVDLSTALEICKKKYGMNHPKVAESLQHLAEIYGTRVPAEAERLYKQALAIRENIPASNHLDDANILNELAGIYQYQERYADAESLYKKALAIREKELGLGHPDVAADLNYLARLYFYNQRRDTEAEFLFKRALAIRGNVLGLGHPEVANVLVGLGELYHVQRRFDEEEPLVKRWLSIMGKVLGSDHPDVAKRINFLASRCHSRGQYVEAESMYKQALAIREKALGPVHVEVAESLNNLGALYMDQRRYAEAEPLFRRSLEIREKMFGQDHPFLATALENLSRLYQKMDRPLDAAYYSDRAKKNRGRKVIK